MSVEHVLVAAIVLIIGFIAFNEVKNSIMQLSENRLSLFEVDESGYSVTLGVTAGEINPLSDFTFVYDAVNEEYSIVAYNNLTDKSVVIPKFYSDGKLITEISDYVFQAKGLTSVILPNSIRVIGNNSFYNNPLITSLVLPVGLHEIGSQAFANNGLTSIVIPNSVDTIGSYAFANNQLTTISIPDTIISYGLGPFNNNKMAQQLAFVYAKNNNGTANKQVIISYAGASSAVTIPSGTVSIDAYAFYNCRITSLVIPSSVTEIGDYAFNANLLTSVRFDGSVPLSLGSSIFGANAGLVSGTIDVPNDQLTAYQVKAISNFGVAVSAFY